MLSLMSSIVDGGHRAIKYTRIDGVKPDIYNEGTHFAVCSLIILLSADLMVHHIMHSCLLDPLAGDTRYIRHSCKAA
jgi:hypothetical protein